MRRLLDRLAIIILNYNSGELTANTAKNILKMDTGAEVIVVDNNSNDNSRHILKRELSAMKKAHLVYSANNNGFAAGNNLGIHVVEKTMPTVDSILIMNPDIDVSDKEILNIMYKILQEHKELGAITVKTIFNGKIRDPNECAWNFMTPKYMALGGTIIGKYISKPDFFYEHKKTEKSEITYMDVVQGCFFMIKLNDLQRVDYLDKHTFLYTEESILAKRLEMIGKRNAVLHNYYIHHNHRHKDKQLFKYKNKVFDMSCYYNSRKYYIKRYSNQGQFFVFFAQILLNLDFNIKKIILRLTLK